MLIPVAGQAGIVLRVDLPKANNFVILALLRISDPKQFCMVGTQGDLYFPGAAVLPLI